MTRLKIIQHNVRHWNTHKINLSNTYLSLDPDIILLNSHGVRNSEQIKIFNYDVITKNSNNEINDGVSIAIKSHLKYKVINNFISECLAIKMQTNSGEIIIATIYLPPRRPYLPMQDVLNLLNYNIPVYIL